MKYLLTTLCFGILVSSGFSQTMKSLMYNTSGVVTYTNTNALAFTNAVAFSSIQDVSLTYKLDLSQGSFIYGTNIVASWISNAFGFSVPIEFFNNAEATTRINLGLGATWLTNTNAANFRSAIGLGDWATFSEGATIRAQSITISDGEQTDYIQFTTSGVQFNGTAASQFRTALGLGATWLTNTNVTNFRTDIGLGQNDQPIFNRVYLGSTTNTYVGSTGLKYAGTGTGGGVGLNIISGLGVENVAVGRSDNPLYIYSNNLSFNGSQSWGTNLTSLATTRTNLGLGGGITTNRTFVSYDGTNYTTNTVTISNGIITGWTQ